MFSFLKSALLLRSAVLFSVLVLGYTYGFVGRDFKLFPYSVMRDAKAAFLALAEGIRPQDTRGLATYKNPVLVPTAISHQTGLAPKYILISSAAGAMKSQHAEGCLAWIVDRKGVVVHSWKNHPHLWDSLETVSRVPGVSGAINPAALHLCDNGDLLATFHGYNTFPFAIGMARFDAESRLVWKKEILTHHCFSVAGDGRIFVPAVEVVDSPVTREDSSVRILSESGKVYSDLVLTLDAQGNELSRISILDSLFRSGCSGFLVRGDSLDLLTDDPTHLNEAHLIAAQADQLAGVASTDLLVSMRNINTVGIIDLESGLFKWISAGHTVAQHSPRVFQNGFLVLDNLGGDVRTGGTQLVHVDFATGKPRVLFPRPGIATPDLCRTVNSGHLDVNPDGKHVLLTLTHAGAIWEVNMENGMVDWEYIFVEPNTDGTRKSLGTAKYVYALPSTIAMQE